MEIADAENYFSMTYEPFEGWLAIAIGDSCTAITTDKAFDLLDWMHGSHSEPRLVIHGETDEFDVIFRPLPRAFEGTYGVVEISSNDTYLDGIYIISDEDAQALREYLVKAIRRAMEQGKAEWLEELKREKALAEPKA